MHLPAVPVDSGKLENAGIKQAKLQTSVLGVYKMPNWITNHLQIVGDPEKIAAVVAEMPIEKNKEDDMIDFQKIRPCHQDLLDVTGIYPLREKHAENLKKHGYLHWHDWNQKNWGTKWSAYYASLEYIPGSRYADFHFKTEGNSPDALMLYLSAKHPEVYFIIACSGVELSGNSEPDIKRIGYYSLINGELIRYFFKDTGEGFDGIMLDRFWYEQSRIV